MKLSVPSRRRERMAHSEEGGYVLLTLLLFVAVLAIAFLAMAPVLKQQVKRDREEELIHRGVQYSRAIKRYVKKFGRYPTRLEDLENTNNIRCLRRRYKDPVSGKDFKVLHLGEVQVSNAGTQGNIPADNLTAGALAAGHPLSEGNSSGFGNGAFGGGAFGGQSGFGNNSSGGLFGGSAPGGTSPDGNTTGANPGTTSFSFNFGSSGASGSNTSQSAGAENSQAGTNSASGASNNSNQTGGANQVFGGGPIVGVASISKDKTIRVFNKKDKYYEWQFVYDPNSDRGGLLTTPGQLSVQGFGTPVQNMGGTPPQNGPFGNQPPGGGGFPGGQPNPGGGQITPQPSPYPQMPPDQGPQ